MPSTSPVAVSSLLALMAISRWPVVTPVANHTEDTMFCLENCPIFTASAHVIIMLVLCQDVWNTV
jgi:hypothetical protein